jgi:hypothetical protein
MKTKISALFLLLLIITTCERVGNLQFYIPRPECKSDWLTSIYYHQPVLKQPAEGDDTDTTYVRINGNSWKAKLFCRPDYKLKMFEENTGYYGEWKLIEITDCITNSVYYPPCEYGVYFELDTVKSNQSPGQLYEFSIRASLRNCFSCSFKFLNDTTIVTSSISGTQVLDVAWVMDYEHLFSHLLSRDTLIIKSKRNLLELKTANKTFLRFFK